MTCAIHPEREATAYCRNCGKPMCAECTRDVRGVLYCENCLAALVSARPAVRVHAPSPAVAALLGFIPGLGAIYNGEYVTGIIHVAVFAGIIAMLHNPLSVGMDIFLGIGLACFYLYMPIEAYRTAREKQMAARGALYPAAAPAAETSPMGAPLEGAPPLPVTEPGGGVAPAPRVRYCSPVTGAVILIAVGILVLLANLGFLQSEWLGHWWPLILVGIGAWWLWRRFREPAEKAEKAGPQQ